MRKVWQSFLDLTPLHAAGLIFLLAFFVRLAVIVIFHPYHDLSRVELERTAISLATKGVYGNPYALPTGPTAHVSPGYTLILAALFRIFGTGTAGEIVKELLASAVTSLQCALIPAVATGMYLDRRAGLLAGLVCALYPAKPLVEIDGDWETPYTALFLMAICVMSTRLWTSARLNWKRAVVHGVCWGLALLFVSALLPMFLIFLAVGLYFCRPAGLERYLKFAAVEILLVALSLAPWVIRNERALGSPIVTRSNFGLEMRISNNDLATANERKNDELGLYKKYHPLQSPEEALKVRRMGEVAYNKQALEQAKEWIRTHPERFVRLSLERARWFWFFTDRIHPVKTIVLDVTALLGFIGLVLVWQEQRVAGTVLGLILLIYPLPNYLIHLGLRQRYPLDWLLTLLTMVTLLYGAAALRRRRPQRNREHELLSSNG